MTERDYVLGTHDEEIARLGLQHRVWRDRVLDAWRRAGIGAGQTVIDAGCGPGWATLDLAEIVGPSGRVLAIDRSQRFIDALEAQISARGLTNVSTAVGDLDQDSTWSTCLTSFGSADAVWCRWILAFATRPRDLLAKIHTALKPGGVFITHEY